MTEFDLRPADERKHAFALEAQTQENWLVEEHDRSVGVSVIPEDDAFRTDLHPIFQMARNYAMVACDGRHSHEMLLHFKPVETIYGDGSGD